MPLMMWRNSVLRIELARTCCDQSFVSMFNRPESRSIMDAVLKAEEDPAKRSITSRCLFTVPMVISSP